MSARLFVALELPADVRAALGTFGHAAAEEDFALRAVPEANLHVTLAFLGHRALNEVGPAGAAVAAVRAPAPELELGGALWLAPRRPHVLTVAVLDRDGGLAALHGTLLAALSAALPTWEPEARPLRPHVTVARVRRGVQPRLTGLPAVADGAFTAASLVLFRSELGDGPARHAVVQRSVLR